MASPVAELGGWEVMDERNGAAARAGSELRVVYLAGPGDAPSVLRSVAQGNQYREVAHVAYSGLVFDACSDLGASLLSISTHPRLDDFSFRQLRAINIEDPLTGRGGLHYHIAQVRFARIVCEYVREFRANVLITGPDPYPFLIQKLAFEGVRIIPALHAVLWHEYRRPSLGNKIAVRLSRHFYSSVCSAILSHPGAAVRQVNVLTEGRSSPIVEFLPLLRKDAFVGVKQPVAGAPVFRVMTVGRVEADKGVFLLLEVAAIVKSRLGDCVTFDVCGSGAALEEAKRRVVALGLESTVILHGWTEMEEMTRLWGESHLALVPTTSAFVEGFNQVIIEAALAGRPIVTSKVCPALEYVRSCTVEVDVDNVNGFAEAIVELATNRFAYQALQENTKEVVKVFLDSDNSFGAAVRQVLKAVSEKKAITPVAIPPKLPGQSSNRNHISGRLLSQ